MKKIIFFISILTIFSGCDKEENFDPTESELELIEQTFTCNIIQLRQLFNEFDQFNEFNDRTSWDFYVPEVEDLVFEITIWKVISRQDHGGYSSNVYKSGYFDYNYLGTDSISFYIEKDTEYHLELMALHPISEEGMVAAGDLNVPTKEIKITNSFDQEDDGDKIRLVNSIWEAPDITTFPGLVPWYFGIGTNPFFADKATTRIIDINPSSGPNIIIPEFDNSLNDGILGDVFIRLNPYNADSCDIPITSNNQAHFFMGGLKDISLRYLSPGKVETVIQTKEFGIFDSYKIYVLSIIVPEIPTDLNGEVNGEIILNLPQQWINLNIGPMLFTPGDTLLLGNEF